MNFNVRAPPQVKETSDFTFTLKTSGSANDIASGTATIPQSDIDPGTISNFVFEHKTGASTIIQTSTEWKIGFELEHDLSNDWAILVTFPASDFNISACTPTIGVGFDTSGSATSCVVSSNFITISGNYVLSSGNVSFEGITGTNPSAVYDTGSFTVESNNMITSTGYVVDTYNSSDTSFTNPFRATAQSLTSVDVVINDPVTNSITGKTGVTYDFTVVHKSNFSANSLVLLEIPSSACLGMSSSGSSITSINLTTPLSSAKTNLTPLTFSYTDFTNPRTTVRS